MKKKYLLVSEIFGRTLQGEGPFIGFPATFIRLYGCVKPYCAFCDSKYAWDGKESPKRRTVKDVLNAVFALDTVAFNLQGKGERWISNEKPLVVITGGEPLVQFDLLVELVDGLQRLKYRVQIETSGKVWPFKYPNCWLTGVTIICSPKWDGKKFAVADMHTGAVSGMPDYYKFVIEGKIKEIHRIQAFARERGISKEKIYIMPEGSNIGSQLLRMPKVFELAVDAGYKMSPRLHVLAFGQRRGV